MLEYGKVIGEDGSVLTHDSEEVIEFFESDEVDIIIQDQKILESFYEEMEEYEEVHEAMENGDPITEDSNAWK